MAAKKCSKKCKFAEGERVLCYEPDLAKTKILYKSKVLKIFSEKDEQGRKYKKFLIHFQGWNSIWDRYVTEEFILKDTEENRKLQKTLTQEAQLSPGGNSHRKERKKRTKMESKPVVIEPAENPSNGEPMEEDNIEPVPNDTIKLPKRKLPALDFPEILKRHSGYNCHLVHDKNAMIRLPCQPNVVTLLENYLKYLARNNFSDKKLINKNNCRPEVIDKHELEKRFKMCIEVLDGLRICFNTYLFIRLLINDNEELQYHQALKMTLQQPENNIQQYKTNSNLRFISFYVCSLLLFFYRSFEQKIGNVPNREELENHTYENKDCVRGKRENLRSSTSQYAESQKTCSDCGSAKSQCSKIINNMFEKVRDEYVSKADEWKAVPDSAYNDEIKQPAIVYGVYHLLRLLEKLPKILALTELQGEKLSIVYLYSNGLLNYLSTQTHLFGPQNYL